jgi:hypothetical protein
MEVLLFKDNVVLKKFPGKGGWTYAALPVKKDKHSHFGWITVQGQIDTYTFSNYKLMPMGDGNLFLPVKAAIRKLLQKQEGDKVYIELYREQSTIDVPENFRICLLDEPNAEKAFSQLSAEHQQELLTWIQQPATEELQIERMATAVNKLALGISVL